MPYVWSMQCLTSPDAPHRQLMHISLSVPYIATIIHTVYQMSCLDDASQTSGFFSAWIHSVEKCVMGDENTHNRLLVATWPSLVAKQQVTWLVTWRSLTCQFSLMILEVRASTVARVGASKPEEHTTTEYSECIRSPWFWCMQYPQLTVTLVPNWYVINERP